MINTKLTEIISPGFYDLHHQLKQGGITEVWAKGGRGSTKSTFITIQIYLGMFNDLQANTIVFRRYHNELRDTVFGQFEWTAAKLGISHLFKFQVSPMQIINIETGQKILFKSADKPKKLKSINIGKGFIKYCFFEEVDQFASYDEIRNILQSVFRGEDNNERVSFYSFNPPKSPRSWVNTECKIPKRRRIVHHSDYTTVPPRWLGRTFIREALHLKEVNKQAYDHEYLGLEVGSGLEVFTNVILRPIHDDEIANQYNIRQGLDFGYAVDPVAFIRLEYETKKKKILLFHEFSQINVSNFKLYQNIVEYQRFLTLADSAEPKSIDELKGYGMNIRGAKKGPDSVEYGIKFLQSLEEIVIDPTRCPKAAREFVNYTYDIDRSGEIKSGYPDKDNHFLDSTRYSLSDDMKRKSIVTSKKVLGLR